MMPTPLFILHIEDDPDDVELLRDAFKDTANSLFIEVVKEGHKALPWLDEGNNLPDVIVMDLNLPKMHGKEILVALKSNESYKNIPVVVLTTSSSQIDSSFCLQNGACAFITKPSTVKGFKDAVEIILSTAKKVVV